MERALDCSTTRLDRQAFFGTRLGSSSTFCYSTLLDAWPIARRAFPGKKIEQKCRKLRYDFRNWHTFELVYFLNDVNWCFNLDSSQTSWYFNSFFKSTKLYYSTTRVLGSILVHFIATRLGSVLDFWHKLPRPILDIGILKMLDTRKIATRSIPNKKCQEWAKFKNKYGGSMSFRYLWPFLGSKVTNSQWLLNRIWFSF